jgi:hypothetical protein
LGGNFCLLSRRIGGGRSSAERWITMFIAPPGAVLIRSGVLAPERVAVLDRLNPGSGLVGNVTQVELDDLMQGFLRPEALDMLRAQPERGLVVVPDGPLWSVPWRAATVLRSRPTTIAPSMTLYSRLEPLPERIRSVVALVDGDVEGAESVVNELELVRDRGHLDVSFDESALDQNRDLLIVLGHGTGDGLSFRLGIGPGLTAHDLARCARVRSALIACCGSARTPPVALPINLPASLLMRGCTHCVGGIWMVPQAPTSRLVAAAVTHIAAGRTLTEATALARAGSSNLLDDWGLASTGSIVSWAPAGT